MIAFALRCQPAGHGFDAWFRSSGDFETQRGAGLVACPICGATGVEKALMAPAIVSKRAGGPMPAQSEAAAPSLPGDGDGGAPGEGGRMPAPPPLRADGDGAGPPPGMAEAFARLQAVARELRARSTYVGDRFAEEARRMHFGETPAHGIHGEATAHEVESLREDGIVALPLPPLPEDGN